MRLLLDGSSSAATPVPVRKASRPWSFFAAFLLLASFCGVLGAAPLDQVRGSLVITVADYFTENRSETRYFIKDQSQPGRTVEILFATKPPDGLRTGTMVTGRGHINGTSLENAEIMAAEPTREMSPRSTGPRSAGMSLPTITPAAGVQSTLIYNLNSAATKNNFTNAQLDSAMFAQTGMTVNTLYQEISFGSVSHVGNAVGPYTIAPPTTCDIDNIQSQADQAAMAAGIDISLYPHRIYMMPNEMVQICYWTGTSYIGGNPGLSWVDTGYFNPENTDIYVILAHEFGHEHDARSSHTIGRKSGRVRGHVVLHG